MTANIVDNSQALALVIQVHCLKSGKSETDNHILNTFGDHGIKARKHPHDEYLKYFATHDHRYNRPSFDPCGVVTVIVSCEILHLFFTVTLYC